MAGSDHPDWPEIRRLYLEPAISIASIAKRYGISAQRIARRARSEGWPARSRHKPATRETDRQKIPAQRRGAAPSAAAREPLSTDARTATPKRPATTPTASSLKARRALVRRLYKAIDTKLKQMERRMAHDIATDEGTSETTAADHERDTRAIGALIANLSRVTEIEADLERLPGSAGPAEQQADRQLADEAERFRREVAERLARLVRPA